MKTLWPLALLLLVGFGCDKASDSKKEAEYDPCDSLREINPHCGWTPHWYHSGVSTNAIDGTQHESLSLESTDADGADYGRLHYATLKLCFHNKQLCGHSTVGVGITVSGMLQSLSGTMYSTPVRIKFDDQKPVRETWGISDDHNTLFPSGHERQFFSQLLTHEKLIVEFSYYEKAPRTITFELAGLSGGLQANALHGPTGEVETSESHSKRLTALGAQQTRSARLRADEQKRLNALQETCAPFADGSAGQVQAKTMALPPRECREILQWTHDAYLDALYNLQKAAH